MSPPTPRHRSRSLLTEQLVKIFRAEGGIPFCKTNVPQTLLAFECANPIFGASSNPYSSARTPGGSSGGEAALITLHGTPIGWGSDSEYVVTGEADSSRRLAAYPSGLLRMYGPQACRRALARRRPEARHRWL